MATKKKTFTASSKSSTSNNMLPWLGISLIVLLLDQLSKITIIKLLHYGQSMSITGFFNLVLVYNKGAAFSFLASASGWQRWFFIVLACGVSIGIGAWLIRLPANARKLTAAGLALVMGGAIGNVIDRFRLGSVVDFIHFHWDRAYFPAFNVADSAITVGAAFLLLDALLDSKRSS